MARNLKTMRVVLINQSKAGVMVGVSGIFWESFKVFFYKRLGGCSVIFSGGFSTLWREFV